jgi:hypothetical protein
MMDRTKARQGLDMLLAAHPNAEVARILRQHQDDDWSHPIDRQPFFLRPRIVGEWPRGVWTEVDLILEIPTDRPPDLTPFAILNHTGNVYRCDAEGAVEDDPFLVVTPL